MAPNFFDSQYPENTISDAQLENEGWYYMSVSNDMCGNHVDSVYVDVKLKQGTPSCTVANQTLIFSGGETLTSVSKGINTRPSAEGNNVNGKLRVQFCAIPVSSTINASVTMTEK